MAAFPMFEPAPFVPDPEFLISMISGMYEPASSASDADELVSNFDLLETLRAMEPELTYKHVYDAMLGMGFNARNIEGAVYWPVFSV